MGWDGLDLWDWWSIEHLTVLIKKKYGNARGEKSKKCEGGVFHRQDWSQFKPLAKKKSFL